MSDTPMNNAYWRDPSPDTSPQAIWALLRENALQLQEIAKRQAETDRKMQETDLQMKETARQMKETDKRIGDLGNRFGELAEHLVAPNIMEKFNALGFTFENIYHGSKIKDSTGKFLAEIDLVLENGDIVIAVEVKSKPGYNDIESHINRMEILRRRADVRGDKRKFRGAIAGAIMSEELRNQITQNGFYSIEQTGDTVKINVPEDFAPREW